MKYILYAQYAYNGFEENEVISVHKSYALAAKALREYALVGAIIKCSGKVKKGDNIRELESDYQA